MNIHFNNKELFDKLMNNKIIMLKVGSHLYGLNDENSDVDYLIIYKPFQNQLYSCFANHHQLQYKEDNIDYNFIDLITFIKNSISGDATINIEAIHSEIFKNSELSFLYENRKMFYNYCILRSYLGLARRDLKHIFIPKKHKSLTERYKNKKILHAIRSYYTAKDIYEGIKNENHYYKNKNHIHFDLYNNIKKLKTDKERIEIRNNHSKLISEFRDVINDEFSKGNIVRYMKIENQKIIDKFIIEYLKTNENKDDIDMNIFYDINEEGNVIY